MHQCLTANRQEMLGAQPQGHKAATFGWLDTFNSHLYRLYLLTGNDEFLKVLPVIEQLDDEIAAAGAHCPEQSPALRQLTEQLHHLMLGLVNANPRREDSPSLSGAVSPGDAHSSIRS